MQPAEQEEYLYRYIGLDSFVNIVQNQALTFVLPSMWEDPAETFAYEELVVRQPDQIMHALLAAIKHKIYAQCWTRLSESDAMWRIYNYSNRALRIRIKAENVALLPDIQRIDVIYEDDVEKAFASVGEGNELEIAWAIKRSAFSHEQEVRLIWWYRFEDEDDAQEHVKAWLALHHEEWEDRIRVIQSFDSDIKKAVKMMIDKLNATDEVKTKAIPFHHIPDFIAGVMVHPLAPQWYVETVRQYCADHNIPFDGQSTLYKKPEHKIIAQAKEK